MTTAIVNPLYAQDAVQLQTIVVDGSGKGVKDKALQATGPVDGYVATVTATGSKTATPLIELPQSVSVVTSKQMEDRNVQNLGQALNYTSGLATQPFGNDVRYFSPIIRGFEGNQSVYLNSFRFIRDFGVIALEPYGLERIDVVRGPASVLYGQGEPGGIINLISKRPTFQEFGNVGLEWGTNKRYVAKADIGGNFRDDISYRLTALGRLADGEQDYTNDDRFYIAPAVTWAPDEDTSLTILASLQRDKGTSQIGLPQQGTLDFNPNGSIPISRYLGEPDFNDNKSTLATIGYELRHRFNETFEFRQNFQYLSFKNDYNNLYYSKLDADMRTVTRGASVQSEEIDSFGVDNQLEANFVTGPLDHTAIFGLDYRNNKQWRSSNFSAAQTTIDLFNPVYGTPIIYDPAKGNISEVRLQQTGLYVQDQIKYDRLSVSLGLRQDWTSTRDLVNDESVDEHALTGRAGAIYRFDNGIAPYLSYATSFNPVSGVNDVTGDMLKPSEGKQYEAGVKFQPDGWDGFLTASVYHLTKTNVTNKEADSSGKNLTVQNGEVRSRGFELEGTTSLGNGLSMVGNYTYTDAKIVEGDATATSNTSGNRPANVPEHSASLWADYSFDENTALAGVSLGAGVRYLGSRYGNVANTIRMPSAVVFDAAIRYQKDNFNAALNFTNLGDERYVASCNFGCFYGEGRSIIANVGYSW
ncbi:TonB-dependent siderophore receptor [Brucella sp. BE17]|uniref:TonB-dependent siderophore receptor n=1 Tax=Brucella sp. BE17 TaxID=3142977 RepID=UPI0031B9B1EF